MQHYTIMCRSLTYAQRAVRALERAGIYASLTRAPQEMSGDGCNYGARVREKDLNTAMLIIADNGIKTGKVFPSGEDWGTET